MNSKPAMRNRNVATAIGVNPSFSAILTTTKELPQKVIRVSIRNASKRPICLVAISNSFSVNPKKITV